MRAFAAFLLASMFGGLGFQKVAYVLAFVLAGSDAIRVALLSRADSVRSVSKTGRGETIH